MKQPIRWIPSKLSRAGVYLSLACGLAIGTAPLRAEPIIGLTTVNSLVTFDSATPGTVSSAIAITGIIGSETLFDIDIRPADGRLYALGSAGRLYSINTTTGAATLNTTLASPLDPAATRFGIDFNPTVDRLRIVSNTGQNLRLTPGSGVTTVDSNLNGAGTGAVSAAYTGNDNDPTTGTALFYIGPSTPTTTFTTSNPNGGVLTTVGPLGVSSTQDVGFDISGLTDLAFASLTGVTGGGSSLYTINLATGAATLVGTIDTGLTLRGIALSAAAVTAIDEPGSLVLACIGLVVAACARKRRLIASVR
jgi:hypothetical protein